MAFKASGVRVSDECNTIYTDILKGKKYRYAIFEIKDEKEVVIEKLGQRNATYDDYLQDLDSAGPDDCRYGLYDFEFTHQHQGTDKQTVEKLFLMSWCPDTARIKKKMVYSSSFDAIKGSFKEGIGKYIQATDMAEASYESVLERFKSTSRS